MKSPGAIREWGKRAAEQISFAAKSIADATSEYTTPSSIGRSGDRNMKLLASAAHHAEAAANLDVAIKILHELQENDPVIDW